MVVIVGDEFLRDHDVHAEAAWRDAEPGDAVLEVPDGRVDLSHDARQVGLVVVGDAHAAEHDVDGGRRDGIVLRAGVGHA